MYIRRPDKFDIKCGRRLYSGAETIYTLLPADHAFEVLRIGDIKVGQDRYRLLSLGIVMNAESSIIQRPLARSQECGYVGEKSKHQGDVNVVR